MDLASAIIRVVVTDANIIINLPHINSLGLLGIMPGYEFAVPDEVVREVTEPGQRQALQNTIDSGVLRLVRRRFEGARSNHSYWFQNAVWTHPVMPSFHCFCPGIQQIRAEEGFAPNGAVSVSVSRQCGLHETSHNVLAAIQDFPALGPNPAKGRPSYRPPPAGSPDDAIIAAEFEDAAAKAAGDYFGGMPSHFRRSGEADEGDSPVVNQHFADGCARVHDQVEDAFESVRFHHAVADFLYRDRDEQRFGRGPPEHAIAAHRSSRSTTIQLLES